jgi:hypothetical protein
MFFDRKQLVAVVRPRKKRFIENSWLLWSDPAKRDFFSAASYHLPKIQPDKNFSIFCDKIKKSDQNLVPFCKLLTEDE